MRLGLRRPAFRRPAACWPLQGQVGFAYDVRAFFARLECELMVRAVFYFNGRGVCTDFELRILRCELDNR